MLRLDEVESRVKLARPRANTSVQFLEGVGYREQASSRWHLSGRIAPEWLDDS